MIKINTKKLSGKQVNEIISLVRENKGKVYSAKESKGLELDLSLLRLREKRRVLKEIRQIKKKEGST